jgi:hypothetical protein
MSTTRTIALRIVSPVLIAGAFAGLAGATEAAAAPAQNHAATAAVASSAMTVTRGYDITNYSQYDAKVVGIQNPGAGDSAPAVGTVLKPGESLHYEKVFYFMKANETTVQLDFLKPARDGGGKVASAGVRLYTETIVGTAHSLVDQFEGRDKVTVTPYFNQISISDASPSTITVSGTDAQAQAQVLNQLCGSTRATCTFEQTKDRQQIRQKVVAGGGWNSQAQARKQGYEAIASASATTNLELTATAKVTVLKAVETSISAKVGQSWTSTKTVRDIVEMSISPKHFGWIVADMPMYRDTGTFTIKLGNTTWVLKDVKVDSVDNSRAVLYGTGERPMTAEELRYMPDEFVPVTPGTPLSELAG